MRYILLLVFALLSAGATNQLSAQRLSAEPCTSDSRPIFDVVSINPSDGTEMGWMRRTQDGLTVTAPLRNLMQQAFGLHDFQISGGLSWVATKNWEVHAKVDSPEADSSQVSSSERQSLYEKNMQQLQSALVERFHLKCHFTSREMPVYDLVVSKGGPKLKQTQGEASKRGDIYSETHGLSSHASGTDVGTDRLAILLSGPTGRFVVDKTGLTGTFDFTLDWANDASPTSQTIPESSSGPTIYTAVKEQLGLKLVPDKGQVPVLVIDEVALPSPN